MTSRIVETTPSSSASPPTPLSSSSEEDEPKALPLAFKTKLASMLSYDSIDHSHEPFPGDPPLSFRHQVPNLLVSSPYTSRAHLLDLDGMDPQSRLLALALTSLAPVRPDYATCAYDRALNWEHVFSILGSLACKARIRWTRQAFYVVEFRSRLKEAVDREKLFVLDKNSHAEAVRSGGLLKYWYGEPDAEGANLATCVWHSQLDAVRSGQGPWHKQAREAVDTMYDMISVQGKVLTVDDEVRGWRFAAAIGADCKAGDRG